MCDITSVGGVLKHNIIPLISVVKRLTLTHDIASKSLKSTFHLSTSPWSRHEYQGDKRWKANQATCRYTLILKAFPLHTVCGCNEPYRKCIKTHSVKGRHGTRPFLGKQLQIILNGVVQHIHASGVHSQSKPTLVISHRLCGGRGSLVQSFFGSLILRGNRLHCLCTWWRDLKRN